MTLIPAERLIDWTPGTYTGVPGGIPTSRTLYKNAVSEGVDNTGATDVSSAINALIEACPQNQYVYLPAGTYRCDSQIYIKTGGSGNHNVTLKGAGVTTILDFSSSSGIVVGPGAATSGSFAVTAGLSKNSDTVTISSTATISTGQLLRFGAENDTSIPVISTFGYLNLAQQIVKVVSKTSTTVTFTPPLYSDYGGGSLSVTLSPFSSQANGIGIEDLLVDMDRYSSSSFTGVRITGGNGCWVKGVRVKNVGSYPIYLSDNLFTEIRRSYADARKGEGSNGAGILVNSTSASLIEDNEIIGNFPDMEVNFGSSGNFVSRNFMFGSYLNANHAPWNQFNLYEGNVSGGFMPDGYFGGAGYDTAFNNKFGYITLRRMTRYYSLVGNVVNRTAASFVADAGTPNLGNTNYTGEATYPSDPWADYGMTGSITSITKGTGSGYLVNNPGGYSAGATTISVDTGTGTILAGDVVVFSGHSTRYTVATSLSGGSFTISTHSSQNGAVGLYSSILDNATVTVESDNISVTLDSGFALDAGFDQVVLLHWNSYAVNQKYVVQSFAGSVANLRAYSTSEPNAIAPPAVSTSLNIGAGNAGFQEKDLVVLSTTIRKGNRWSDNTFDSLGGDALPDSLAYAAKPQWLLDADSEFSTTFNLKPFDPVGGATAGDSDIPAGYRYTYQTPPEHTSASINADGTELSIGLNKPVTIGAGGAASAILSGGLTCAYDRMEGSTIIFTTPRTITEGESLLASLTNASNGYEDVFGNDLPGFSNYSVVNSSSSTVGVNHYGPDALDMTSDAGYSDSAITLLQPCVSGVDGTATAIRFYIADNVYDAPIRATICDASGNVLTTSNLVTKPTVTGVDRWQSVPVTSLPVTEGTTYLATLQFLGGGGDPILRGLSGQPANSSYYHIGNWFSDLPAQFTGTEGLTSVYALQIRVAPTIAGPNLSVGALNVGTLSIT